MISTRRCRDLGNGTSSASPPACTLSPRPKACRPPPVTTSWWTPCGCIATRSPGYAGMTNLEVWYDHKGIDDVLTQYDAQTREQVERDIAKAFRRGHDRAVRRLAEIRRRWKGPVPRGSADHRAAADVGRQRGRGRRCGRRVRAQPARRQAGADGPLSAPRRGAPGGRGRQRRDAGLGGPVRVGVLRARRPDRAADQAGRTLGSRAPSRSRRSSIIRAAESLPDNDSPKVRRTVSWAGAVPRRASALLRPSAVGPQGSFGSDDDEPGRAGQPCQAVRLGARPGARALGQARR